MMRSTPSIGIAPGLVATAAFTALLGATAHASLAAVDITACGQLIPTDEIGVLQADLDCASTPGIVLEEQGTLDFAGHRITDASPYAVRCAGNVCTLRSSAGTGEIIGSATAISVWGGRGPVQVSDLTIRDTGPFLVPTQGAIDAVDARLDLTRVRILNATANYGVIARRIRATDVQVSGGTGIGLFAIRSLVASNLTADGNGEIGVLAPLATELVTPPGSHVPTGCPDYRDDCVKGIRIDSFPLRA